MKINDLIAYITEAGAGIAVLHVAIKKAFNFESITV